MQKKIQTRDQINSTLVELDDRLSRLEDKLKIKKTILDEDDYSNQDLIDYEALSLTARSGRLLNACKEKNVGVHMIKEAKEIYSDVKDLMVDRATPLFDKLPIYQSADLTLQKPKSTKKSSSYRITYRYWSD